MGANVQSNQKLKIHFALQKEIEFGKAIYFVGNITQLGCWRIENSLRLSWFKDHYWTGFINIDPKSLNQPIQYKYVIANWDNPKDGNIEWEAGKRNRSIQSPYDSQHILCENSWNMEKITLNLLVPDQGKHEEYQVIGDCTQLGNWKKSYKLKHNDKKNISKYLGAHEQLNEKKYRVYSFTFEVYRAKSKIHYYYIKKGANLQIERKPGRRYALQTGFNSHPKCLKVGHYRGDTEMYEICNFHQLNYSKVTENLLLGPYLHTPEDFELLKNQGVSSILSIQTNQDFASHKLTEDYLHQQAGRNNIQHFTYAIQDMCKDDFVKKCHGAIQLLQKLIKQGKKVYIHCSAGIYRSPQIVVLYLVLSENYTLENAIEVVKSRHRFAQPNARTMSHALNFYYENKENSIFTNI